MVTKPVLHKAAMAVNKRASETSSMKRSIVDSGATTSIRLTTAGVSNVRPVAVQIQTASADTCIKATGEGALTIPARLANGELGMIELDSVLVVPEAEFQLTSVNSLVSSGHAVFFSKDRAGLYLNQDQDRFVPFTRYKHLWYLEEEISETAAAATTEGTPTISPTQLFHLKCGHLNPKYMRLMKKHAKGVPDLPEKMPSFTCHCCREGKMRVANQAPASTSRASEPLEVIHVDTAGPLKVQSIHAERYVTCFTDDFSRYRFVYCHRTRSDLMSIFKRFMADAQALLVYSKIKAIRRVRSDGGGEYTSQEFEQFLLDNQIRHEYSNPHEQFGNGRAERSFGIIFCMARAMHITSALPTKLWSYAVKHAVFLLNRVPSRANPDCKTPYEMMRGKQPNVSKLMPYGCLIYLYQHRSDSENWKISPRGIPAAYIGDGEADGSKACIGYNLNSHAIHYTTSYWPDHSFFPCRRKTDRRVTDCSFGSYPEDNLELVQLYTLPDDGDVLETTGTSQSEPITVAQFRSQAEQELYNQVVSGSVSDQSKANDQLVSTILEGLQQDQDQVLGKLTESSAPWELLGYDVDSDQYLIKVRDKIKFVTSDSVIDKIQNSGKVFSSAMDLNFASYDPELEEFITTRDDSDFYSEVDKRVIQEKLTESLQAFLRGDLTHGAYSSISNTMMKQYQRMLDPQGESTTNEPETNHCNVAAMNAAIAVKAFAIAVIEQKQVVNKDPKTLQQALRTPERDLWIEAVRKEINKLVGRGVFRFITASEVPAGKKVFPMHIILRRKTNQFGETTALKARCVVDGSKMTQNVDYFESYAPVVDFGNFRLVIAYGHAKGWKIHQLDITLAFTWARPQSPTYVKFTFDLNGIVEGIQKWQIAQLNYNLYGDVSAPFSWSQTFKSFLLDLGFSEVGGHPCVFIKRDDQGYELLLAVYVDDILATTPSDELFQWFVGKLGDRFEYTYQGEASYCLGVEFIRSENGKFLTLSQQKYAKNLLTRFGMTDCKGVKTPMDPTIKLSLADCPEVVDPVLQREYRAKVGCLMYLAISTRPDLMYCVGYHSRYLHAPGVKHLQSINRAFQYLKDTTDRGITYVSDSTLLSPIFSDLNQLVAYSDADFAGCLDSAKSTTGFVILMNNGPIIWKASRQPTVMLSTSAAETQALMKTTVWAEHLRNMLDNMGSRQQNPTVIYCDNRTAIYVAEGRQMMTETQKHVTVQSKFVAERVALGVVLLQYVQTGQQRADIFTKALPGPAFRYHRDALMMTTDNYQHQALSVKHQALTSTSIKLSVALQNLVKQTSQLQWRVILARLLRSRKHEISMWADEVKRLQKRVKTMKIRLAGKMSTNASAASTGAKIESGMQNLKDNPDGDFVDSRGSVAPGGNSA